MAESEGKLRIDNPVGPALPRRRLAVVLAGHTLVIVLYALLFANVLWLMPLLVRLHFGAADPNWRDWQTMFVTAALPTFMVASVFWGDLLRRVRLHTYLALFWLLAALPLAGVALAHSYTWFFICHILASAGVAGWTPVYGKLLKAFYPDAVRGRIYGVLNVVQLAGGVVSIYFVGAWFERQPEGFRVFLPIAAALQMVGVGVLIALARWTGTDDVPIADERPRHWRRLLEPVVHMRAVLREDRVFGRYEVAFMTYGAAFMICDALLPVLGTDRLHMRYEEYSQSTQMTARIAMLAMTMPMGALTDRIGAVRISALAFGILALFPVLLSSAWSVTALVVASVIWGIGMSGVMMGWMLGPVALAPTPDKVPQYVAIHASLVGLRGVVFQFLGMLLYKLTGSFTWPLVMASLLFGGGAYQMWRLHGSVRRAAREAELPPPATTVRAT